jgi:hypothetical protein
MNMIYGFKESSEKDCGPVAEYGFLVWFTFTRITG